MCKNSEFSTGKFSTFSLRVPTVFLNTGILLGGKKCKHEERLVHVQQPKNIYIIERFIFLTFKSVDSVPGTGT